MWLFLLIMLPTLVPGTSSTWTDGTHVWAGNPYCGETGALLQPSSPAIDAGTIIEGFHCPNPGPGVDCQEWYGKAPDIGACEYVATVVAVGPPNPPAGLKVNP